MYKFFFFFLSRVLVFFSQIFIYLFFSPLHFQYHLVDIKLAYSEFLMRQPLDHWCTYISIHFFFFLNQSWDYAQRVFHFAGRLRKNKEIIFSFFNEIMIDGNILLSAGGIFIVSILLPNAAENNKISCIVERKKEDFEAVSFLIFFFCFRGVTPRRFRELGTFSNEIQNFFRIKL